MANASRERHSHSASDHLPTLPSILGRQALVYGLKTSGSATEPDGVDDDHFIIQYLPIYIGEHVRAWLKFLPHDSIHNWADLKRIFIRNFQGTYVHPGNSWDLKSYQQEPNESLQDYIRRFSKRCNSLPNVIDANVISAFLSGTTCESLIHKRVCLKPGTTRDLLNIATNHASGKEAVGAVSNGGRDNGKAKREDQDEGPSM